MNGDYLITISPEIVSKFQNRTQLNVRWVMSCFTRVIVLNSLAFTEMRSHVSICIHATRRPQIDLGLSINAGGSSTLARVMRACIVILNKRDDTINVCMRTMPVSIAMA